MAHQWTFKTERQAKLFKIFLNWKGIPIALRSNNLTVVPMAPFTDDEWNELVYQFGRWS